MAPPSTDYDNPWKSIIELYFRDFISFFFPWIEPEIDWSREIKFLDKELQKVVRDAEIVKRYADKLIEVHRIDGETSLVLCHIEVQSQYETDFASRMYSYNYRLRDRYNCSVASLAILGDETENWRPRSFHDALWRCSVKFEFPVIKLLDYESQWDQLAVSRNPFAIVVMAHLKTKETHNNFLERKDWKLRLTIMLYEQGYEPQDILELYNFLDWLMQLPKTLEQQFQVELEQFEETRQMKYVTAIERMAEERGQEQGQAQGQAQGQLQAGRSIVLRQLARRLGELPDRTLTQINALSIEQLELLGEALLDFTTIANLTQWLEQ